MNIPYIKVTHDTYSVYHVSKKIEKGRMKFTDLGNFSSDMMEMASKIVESVILHMPIPSVAGEVSSEGVITFLNHNFIVNALVSFMEGKFPLIRTRILKDYEGMFYKDIQPIHQNAIDDYQLDVYYIQFNEDEELKKIFLDTMSGRFIREG